MKFVLLLAAVGLLFWMLRGGLRGARRPPRMSQGEQEATQPMLRCAQCGLHLPRDEALPGRGGVFCSAAHRTAFETAHPPP